MYRRYAIYFVPEGPLAVAGSAWLGWDIARGCTVDHPKIDGLDIAAITKRPRKYGLHATLKPPMALAARTNSDELIQAAVAVAKSLAPIPFEGLNVTQIGRFAALTLKGDKSALNALAANVVQTLDRYRAPLAPEELARRRHRPLSPSQERNLVYWGYPYVMEDFNFHITLTGPLHTPDAVIPLIAAHFAPVLPERFILSHLNVVGEDADGMFHMVKRLPVGN